MTITITETPAKAAGEHINKLIGSYAGDTLCLLSGGSALETIQYIDQPEIDSDTNGLLRTIFIFGDERGSREQETNNYQQLVKKHPTHWVTANCLNSVPNENETIQNFANRLSMQLDQTLAKLKNPQVLYLMGIGSDGHTAGIFPLPSTEFSRQYKHDQSIVPVVIDSLKIAHRASVTPQWITRHVDHIVGYAAGESKKMILESLKTETKPIHERPAEILKTKESVTLYTDQPV